MTVKELIEQTNMTINHPPTAPKRGKPRTVTDLIISFAAHVGCLGLSLLIMAVIIAVLALPIAALFRLIHG